MEPTIVETTDPQEAIMNEVGFVVALLLAISHWVTKT